MATENKSWSEQFKEVSKNVAIGLGIIALALAAVAVVL